MGPDLGSLSVQETYFWREMSQINALIQVIIPDWFRKASNRFAFGPPRAPRARSPTPSPWPSRRPD